MNTDIQSGLSNRTLDALIFDLDGTLWDSTETIAAAWNRGLMNYGLEPFLTPEILGKSMGKTVDQLRQEYFGEYPKEEGQRMLDHLFEVENKLVEERGGNLFPEVREVLEELHRKYDLMIVSNCGCGYIEAFLSFYRLEELVCDFESNGGTGLPKGENIRLIMERNGTEAAAYVGDTMSDFEATRVAGVPFIYASYGFGEVPEDQCDWVIRKFSDLRRLLRTSIG